jgi:threonine/homoserine/homoserine lactone efflux protein
MVAEYISKGFIIGLSIAVIVGPITILCIKRTLSYGFKKGLLTGVGSSMANCIYGVMAGIGLAEITTILVSYEGVIAGVGGIILVLFGMGMFRAPILGDKDRSTLESSLFHSFISAFLISLTNPMTILLFAAFYTGFEKNNLPSGYDLVIHLPLGVFLGSVTWWLALTTVIDKAKVHFSQEMLIISNKIFGLMLLALAAYAFMKAFRHVIL